MSRVLKTLKKFAEWMPRGSLHDELYGLERGDKVYPYKFKTREEKVNSDRKLKLYLTHNYHY